MNPNTLIVLAWAALIFCVSLGLVLLAALADQFWLWWQWRRERRVVLKRLSQE